MSSSKKRWWLVGIVVPVVVAIIKIVPWLHEQSSAVLVVVAPWFRTVTSFLASNHQVPGWLMAIAIASIACTVFLLARQQIHIRESKPKRPISFAWSGLDWELAPYFNENCSKPLSDIAPRFLKNLITGPLCPDCKRDVAPVLVPEVFETANVITVARNSCECGRPFAHVLLKEREVLVVKGGMAHDEFLERLRGSVYREAQAAARKRKT